MYVVMIFYFTCMLSMILYDSRQCSWDSPYPDMRSWVILMNCLASSALLGTECIDLDVTL